MVTGIETVSIVLAVLPLLLNQLDNYVQGLETLKSFRAKKYRWEIEGYLSSLGTEQAIFLNTLEQAVDGVTDFDDDFRSWIDNPDADSGVSLSVQMRLQEKFGRNYAPFTRTMDELSRLLEDLSEKLGLGTETSFEATPNGSSILKREVKKFRDIFSKSVYAELLNRIHTANTILKTLVEQSHHRQAIRTRRGISKRTLLRHRMVRQSANSLHHAILRGNCWKCPCKGQHCVHLVLDSSSLGTLTLSDNCASNPQFRLVFASITGNIPSKVLSHWHEVEAVSNTIPSSQEACHSSAIAGHENTAAPGRKKPKVSFALVATTPEPLPSLKIEKLPPAPPIADICSTLSTITTERAQRKLLGCVTNETHRHNIYHVRNVAASLRPQSLAELIAASSTPSQALTEGGRFFFSRRDRLRLAANLACSVLHFQGSWLRRNWRARDIMFPTSTSAQFDQPYVLWDVADNLQEPSLYRNSASTVLIRNEAVFPLGLVLVELSLCQNLETLRTKDDDDAVQAVADLKTAARHIPAVEMESGSKYAEVAERCLFWPGRTETQATLDDEKMQGEVFQSIIKPLIENLRDFEGSSLEY